MGPLHYQFGLYFLGYVRWRYKQVAAIFFGIIYTDNLYWNIRNIFIFLAFAGEAFGSSTEQGETHRFFDDTVFMMCTEKFLTNRRVSRIIHLTRREWNLGKVCDICAVCSGRMFFLHTYTHIHTYLHTFVVFTLRPTFGFRFVRVHRLTFAKVFRDTTH